MKQLKLIINIFIALIIGFPINAQTISVKMMSMNIKEGGELANYNAKAYSDCIKKYNPDFVLFQEMDHYTIRNGNKDLLGEIAVNLGMFPYFGRAFSFSSGSYGNGILSKYPFYNARTITFKPTDASEQRSCAWIDVVLPNKRKIRIAVTHLDTSNDQVRVSSIATINNNIFSNNINMPILSGGDFNASPGSETMNYAFLKWQDIGSGIGNTISSSNPTKRIDYILGYPKSWEKITYQVIAYPELSDHCFIVAELQFD
jgi:endonuclease/exonuclease/phosphatase family metal-dependent hydrolase